MTDAYEPIDLSKFLSNTEDALAECQRLAEMIKSTSCLIVRDPRVPFERNGKFLDMMERYFDQPREKLDKDIHPEFSYQVGATPGGTELPRRHLELINSLTAGNEAHVPDGPDVKWRFFWRIGERPVKSEFAELNCDQVLPEDFPEWRETMNGWGSLMLQAVHTVCEMLSLGLGLPKNSLTDLLVNAPHLLAPTGSNLTQYHNKDQIFAGFHTDLSFLTIHGKSRFPGLYIWLRNGTKALVHVPDGCLLLQAGKQLEWLTGGLITAGFHEVVVCDETIAAYEAAKKRKEEAGESGCVWRVSSTLFSHVASDKVLVPFEQLVGQPGVVTDKYPPKKAGDQVREELEALKLQTAKTVFNAYQ